MAVDQKTREWLKGRQWRITGTDMPKIILNKEGDPSSRYGTPLSVYVDKTTEIDPKEPTFPMRMGHLLQPVVAQLYLENKPANKLIEPGLLTHKTEDWAGGTPDYIVTDVEGKWLHGLECKTTSYRRRHEWGESGSQKMPMECLIQSLHYLHICRSHWPEMNEWHVAVLIGGSEDFREYCVKYDKDTEWAMMEVGREFWTNHVLKKIPPDPVSGKVDAKVLDQMWHKSIQTRLDAPPESPLSLLAEDLGDVREKMGILKARESDITNRMKFLVGDSDGVDGRDWTLTWRRNKPRTNTDWKAVCDEVKVSEEVIEKHTKFQMGSRPFRFISNKGDE